MFHNNPTTKKIIPAWSLNHSLEIIVSSFKNSTNSRDKLLKILFLTALCGNRVAEVTAMTREGLSFTGNHVILPTKSNYQHKNTEMNSTYSNNRVRWIAAGNPPEYPVGALRVYLKHTENKEHRGHLFLFPRILKAP